MAEHWVELGRLGRPKGLKGWQRLESWTDPEQGIFAYQPWNLRHPSGARHTVDEVEHQRHGEGWLVRLNGVQSRDEAAAHVGCWVEVRRAQLPTLPPGEHYRVDMLGLRVRNLQNIELGRVVRIEEMPAHPVMVVQAEGERGVEERWLPYTREHVRQVDLESGWIEIDWPEDF